MSLPKGQEPNFLFALPTTNLLIYLSRGKSILVYAESLENVVNNGMTMA